MDEDEISQKLDGRVVVTGAAGHVGAAIVRRLVVAGAEVHALVHPRTDLARLDDVDGLFMHRVDVCVKGDVGLLIAGLAPAGIVHAAAPGGHPKSVAEESDLHREALGATEAVVAAVEGVDGCYLVQIGSSLEYAPRLGSVSESDQSQPASARGRAKLDCTREVLTSDRLRDRCSVLRLFRVFGPGEQPGRLFPVIAECIASGGPLPLPDVMSVRDYVHVDDVAEAVYRCLLVRPTGSPVIDIGSGELHGVEEILRIVEDLIGRELPRDVGGWEPRGHDQESVVADRSRAADILGWEPSMSLREGLAGMFGA